MFYKNIEYNGVNISKHSQIVIDNFDPWVVLRTTLINKETYHGQVSSKTLADNRLYTIDGRLFGVDRKSRQNPKSMLDKILIPEWVPTDVDDGFHTLKWEDEWQKYQAEAKIYSMPTYNRNNRDVINFRVEFLGQNSFYYSQESYDDINTDAYGTYWWFVLPVTSPFSMDNYRKAWVLSNESGTQTPMKIEVQWSILNPRVVNVDSGRYYGVNRQTSDLVIDNTGDRLIVTDGWINVKSDRIDWSTALYLEPWNNRMALVWDDYTEDKEITVRISYRYTFMHN